MFRRAGGGRERQSRAEVMFSYDDRVITIIDDVIDVRFFQILFIQKLIELVSRWAVQRAGLNMYNPLAMRLAGGFEGLRVMMS